MKYIFIVNPAAGKGIIQQQLIKQIKQQLRPEQYELYLTVAPGDEERYIKQRLNQTSEELWFFACGGDGTITNIINGLQGRAPLGIIPCGSGNDFAKNILNADFFNLSAQLQGTPVPVDLLRCNGRLAANVINLGFDADVSYHMIHFKSLPLVSGKASYLLSLIYCYFRQLTYPMEIWLDDDPAPLTGQFIFALFANGQIYGGSFHGAPRAEINDGYFDVCLCRSASKLTILRLVSAFQHGKHLQNPDFSPYITYRQCRRARVLLPEPTTLGLDGNCTLTTTAEIAIEPAALQLILPQNSRLKRG